MLTLLTMLTAIGSIVVLYFTWQCKKSDLYNFMVYVIYVMEEYPYIQNLITGAFLTSASLFISSFLTGTFGLLGKTSLAKFGLFLCFCSAGGMTAGGIISLGFVGDLDKNVNANRGAGDPAEQESFKRLQDFSVAMYSGCCLAEQGLGDYVDPVKASDAWGFLKAEQIEAYTSDFIKCEFLEANTVDKASIEYALASCFNDEGHLQWFKNAVTEQMCTVFEETTVDIDGKTLFDFTLSSLTEGVTDIVLRGKAEPGILGCGGGKLKAFQVLIYFWFQSLARPIALSLLIVGIASLLILMFAVASTCLSQNEDMDVDMSAIQNYIQRNSVRTAALNAYNSATPLEESEVQMAQPIGGGGIDDKL